MAKINPLDALRAQLTKYKVDAFIVPSADEFQGEYLPAAARRLEFLTEFTGSNGIAIVHKTKAAFFTDGRYTLQAETQVPKTYEKYNMAQKMAAAWAKELKKAVIGFDPKLFTLRQLAAWEKQGIKLKAVPNLVDAIWKHRPVYPADKAFAYPLKYAGESSDAKIKRVLKMLPTDALFIAAPDSVCWLLNIRGNDIPHTPFLNGTALLHKTGKITLFVDAKKIPKGLLGKNISIMSSSGLTRGSILKLMDSRVKPENDMFSILLDPAHSSVWWAEQFEKVGATLVKATDPIQAMKACKNAVEASGIRAAHVRDGAALSSFLCWLDTHWQTQTITEVSAAEKLKTFRAAQPLFKDLSFGTIAGMGSNGAIVHYHATAKTAKKLTHGMFLLDSGGQYWDGTTDVTRTIALGAPTDEQKEDFTRVLKGHIALGSAVFPKGVTGSELDALARMPLWHVHKDYDHGTGHGVGCYLSVHEGPQRISRVSNNVALEPGMVISNEPGFYKAGAYGIRIENLVLVEAVDKKFLRFETLTMAPIDRRLIDKDLLNSDEINWLNNYHTRVLTTLAPLVDKKTAMWLKKMCAKI